MQNSISKIGSTLRQVLQKINEEPAGIAFIIDFDEKLCGVITDGDFRRLLLSGKRLDQIISEDDLNDFVFARQGENLDQLLEKSNRKVRVIPIVNDRNEIVNYFRYEHRTHFTPVAQPILNGNEFKYLTDALLSTWISSNGKYIDKFESEFSNYCNTKYGVATSNGTVAIHLALKALEIGQGDEVIIPDLTFGATINAVLHANATPVIVDVDPVSWTINPDEIKKAINPNTKAIIPVHLYGQPCDMDSILPLAQKHNIKIIEDAAEAHGALYKGKPVGSFGDISCFSFFANKIITTGEGGMCLTNSEALNYKMKILRDHGMSKTHKYWHEEVGYNYRMTNLQAAIGCAQLERIDEFINKRKQLEFQYRSELNSFDFLEWQKDIPNNSRVIWLISTLLRITNRNQLIEEFKNHNIDVRPFFYPLSQMPLFAEYSKSPTPVSHNLSKRGVNFPTIIDQLDFGIIRNILSKFSLNTN